MAATVAAQCPSYTAALETLEAAESPIDLGMVEKRLLELLPALAVSNPLARQGIRERAVRALQGKVTAPARMVDAVLSMAAGEEEGDSQGKALDFADLDPWPDPVDGSDMLHEVEQALLRHAILPEGASVAIALWVVHTFAYDAAAVSPLLTLVSPEKRCGKTTVLTLLASLTKRSLPTSNISPSALFRAVEKYQPTLLVDEADAFLNGREELRGILNSGHTRETAYVIRTVGDQYEPRRFSTWAPKAVALIGSLPPTLTDRSISIPMRRRAQGESVVRLRLDRLDFGDLRRRILRWVEDYQDRLRSADPAVPEQLNDRAADNWRPLLAIADLAGDEWPQRARRAAIVLSGSEEAEEESAGILLLSDVRVILREKGVDRIFTEDLLATLRALENRPWSAWGRAGRPLSSMQLSRLLRPYKIKSRKLRMGALLQGYLASSFEDAFSRYLPPESEHPEQINGERGLRTALDPEHLGECSGSESPANACPPSIVPGVPGGEEGADAGGDWGEL